jgi:ABC-type transport system substrate-binding protein
LARRGRPRRPGLRSLLHQVTPLFSTEYFFFRTTWGPWARREVRQALLLAIPWKELRDGHLIPATTLVFPIAGYPKLDGIATEDAAKARELLAQAGFADPASAPELVIRVPTPRPSRR